MSAPTFLILCAICTLFGVASSRTFVDDGHALLAFKASIVDDPLGALKSWTESLIPDPCAGWKNVGCNAKERVVTITLGGQSLAGTISGALGSLDQLTYLDLSSNTLQGSIPSSLGNLTNLVFLDLSFLDFTDPEPIPPSLGTLGKLQRLHLSNSNLHGVIPPALGDLRSLSLLKMDSNNLTSTIPAELSKLSGLMELDLSNNFLSSPFPAKLPPLVQRLFLGTNNFSGPIPDCVLHLPAIIHIGLENNYLSGPIPAAFGNLSTLTILSLGGNQLTGSIPEGFGRGALLSVLDLSNNKLGGPLPSDFKDIGSNASYGTGELQFVFGGNSFTGPLPEFSEGQAQALFNLDLSGNQFHGGIPESYANLTTLENLYLQDNNLTGSVPVNIYSDCCTAPRSRGFLAIDVSNNYLSGPLPSQLFNNTNCGAFLAAGNAFSGPLPPSLNQIGSNLITFEVQNNSLSGPLPVLDHLLSLQSIQVQGNQFSGPIPSNFLNWTAFQQQVNLTNIHGGNAQLNRMDMSNNRLNGSIPPQLGGIPTLNFLHLANNRFTGGLPPTLLGPNSNFVTLDVRNNSLHGPLNFSAAHSPALQSLLISGNAFNGSFPTGISAFGTLQFLDLAQNAFEGPILDEIGALLALLSLSLDNNSFSGPLPLPLFNFTQLLSLTASLNHLNGTLPPQIGLLNRTLMLDLHSNRFQGPIPENISRLEQVVYLDLSDNAFDGPLPPPMAGLSNLQYFNVSSNLLTGVLPGGNLTTRSTPSSYFNNSGLCGAPLPNCPTHLSAGAIAGIVIGAVLALAILVGVSVYLYLRQRRFGPDGGELILFFPLPVSLTYKDILVATDNWGEKSLLGVGGFGSVYKAQLRDGKTAVAIKRLAQGSSQGLAELKAEMNTLGKLKHKNLVRLIGSYISTTESLLIYELLSAGDLDSYLFGEKKVFEDWSVRLNMLLGSARGFKYLHHDTAPAIIHRDIKPPNILIDDDLEARVADFGLAETIDLDEHTHLSTSVSGTVGYLAPEYSAQGKLTTKSDVYAFGVVILQVMTGRRPTDKTIGDSGLTKWVSSHWANSEAIKVIDPRLKLDESIIPEVSGALKLGLMCTSRNMRDRPSMADVVHLLENLDMFGGMDRFDMQTMDDDRSDVYSIGASSQPNSSANASMLNVIMEARD